MKFQIPKLHYRKRKGSSVVMLTIPKAMIRELEIRAEKSGWSFTELIDLILDQYFYAVKGRKTLFEHEYAYVKGDKESKPLRIDKALYKEIKGWADKTNQSASQVICLALNMFLCQR